MLVKISMEISDEQGRCLNIMNTMHAGRTGVNSLAYRQYHELQEVLHLLQRCLLRPYRNRAQQRASAVAILATVLQEEEQQPHLGQKNTALLKRTLQQLQQAQVTTDDVAI